MHPYRNTLLLLLAFSTTMFCGEKSIRVKVTNPSRLSRHAETVAIRWTDLKSNFRSTAQASPVVFDDVGTIALLSQTTSDDLLFQSDFQPGETKIFRIAAGEQVKTGTSGLVYGGFMQPRQDYAWENDRIAFRVYGPALAAEVNNGIDVWTKRVRSLIVAKWYKGDDDTGAARIPYHIDHGEGADFFSVGRSLGAGGSGIWFNNRLYQPGVFTSQQTLCTGPLRVAFELTYQGWDVEGKKLTEVKRITLDAGQNLNRIDVTFLGAVSSDTLVLACGLVKRKNTVFHPGKKNHWMALWGATTDDPVNGSLGTGLVLSVPDEVTMLEDKDQYMAMGKYPAGTTYTYYAGAGWTRSGDFVNAEAWERHLQEFLDKLHSPLEVTVVN